MAAAILVAVAVAVATVTAPVQGGEDLRNVIITGFGELPYEPAPGWQPGGFFQSDVFPVDVNGNGGPPQTMDVALRTSIRVEDPNEKKSSSEDSSAEDGEKSSSTNRQVSDKNISLDQDKAKEIEEELLTARTRNGLRRLNHQRNAEEKSTTVSSVPKSSIKVSQYRQTKTLNPSYTSGKGYNNREYDGDLGEGWNLEDAEEILGGRNYNILIQNPNGYNPKSYPPPLPPPREVPPPRFPPSSFYPFPGFGYKPFPPPPAYGRTSRAGYRRSDTPRPLREEVVYGRSTDAAYRPSQRRGSSPSIYQYYDDYLSGA